MVRGRAVYMLDAWTGDEVWRFARMDSSGPADPRHYIFPVASTVGMVDLGPGPNSVGPQDGLFDTALVGDLAGQMWVFRFFAPGEDSNSDGRADNWFGGRVFEQFKGLPLRHKSPFYQLPAATILLQGGAVRVYSGTGDRLNIRDRNGGDCGLVNLGACVRKDCTTEVVTTYNKNGVVFAHGTWKYTAAGTALTTNTFTVDSAGITSSCSDLVRGDYTVNVNCGAAQAFNYAACCDWDATNPSDCDSLSSSALMCPIENGRPTGTRIDKTYTTTNARFYSIKLFDSATRAPFTTFATAQSYDNARLTDADLINADLASSDSGGPGWFVGYAQQNERTASGTNLLSGCVIWNTLEPAAAAATCGVVQGDNARQYLAHHVTGATTCGSVPTTSRFTLRTSVVPPPMPTPVVSVNPVTGEVRYSVISLEPGAAPAQQSVGQSDILGTIHWLEVPRQLHRCRHVSGVNCQ
jgi:type IV pilus assembly protein PilY1